jgi:hypothetical protein
MLQPFAANGTIRLKSDIALLTGTPALKALSVRMAEDETFFFDRVSESLQKMLDSSL